MRASVLISVAVVGVALSASASAEVKETDPVRIWVRPTRPLVTELAKPQPGVIDAPKVQGASVAKIVAVVRSAPF